MGPRAPRRSIAIALAATFAIPIGLTVTARAAAPPLGQNFPPPVMRDSTCYKYATADRQFTDKMNEERQSRGLGTMRLDPELSWVAKKHTQDMIKANQIFHSSSQQLTSRITRWSTLGENVGVGGDVDSLHQAYMDSPSHRENILFKGFLFVGVGTIVKDGKMWTTTIFELRNNPGTRLRMPC